VYGCSKDGVLKMKSKLLIGLFLSLLARAEPSSPAAQTNENPEARLKGAAKALIVSGFSQDDLQVLFDYSRKTSSVPFLRSRAMAIYALASLANGDTNLFERARLSHLANFPDDHKLIPMKLSDCIETCEACNAAGYTETANTCSTCMGTRLCSKCKGTGKWMTITAFDSRKRRTGQQLSNMSCEKCKGSGRCPSCNGFAVSRTPCASCRGAGTFFRIPKTKLADTYKTLLGALISVVEREESLAARISLAKAETDLPARIRGFETLLQELRDRPERGELERLLRADQETRKRHIAEATESDQRRERELATLRALKNSSNPQAAIITLRGYLADNPASAHRLEIQALLDDTVARVESQREKKKLMYIVGTVVLILFALSCVNINYFKYTLLPSASATGAKRQKQGSELFTDPLSLNAKDSRSRTKIKTSEIPLPSDPNVRE